MVVPIVPVDILRIITGYYAEDKRSLLNLLLVSQDFRRLVEPYIYASVSFLASGMSSAAPRVGYSDADISVMASNFMRSIARDSGCAHYVNSLSLPCNSFQGDHYPLFQSILKSLSNLEDLRVYPSSSPNKTKSLNFRTLFEDSKRQNSQPPFALKAFAWYTNLLQLDSGGFEWFLASQKSLQRLSIPYNTYPSLRIPTLPKLRTIHLPSAATKTLVKTNQITRLYCQGETLCDLECVNNEALRDVVVCIIRGYPKFEGQLSPAAIVLRMPNLECLEINTLFSPIPDVLSQIYAFQATKLRHLRFHAGWLVSQQFDIMEEDPPWDHGNVLSAFDRLPSLTHISFRLGSFASFPEYCCFTRGTPRAVKLRSLRPVVMDRTE